MAAPNLSPALRKLIDAVLSGLWMALRPPGRFISSAEHERLEAEIHDAARLTTSYSFMLFSACGIAALGLLQSSVAVVIGAMLISPLMGPILSMGLALARVEPVQFKKAALTLAVGALLAIAASTIIVWASPLKDVTPEILARTRPTLLDLIVALLSGFVGAYLTVKHRGGAIAGVAIATALMPPLAVVGYGVATASAPIAGGALLLFLTNVVAILGAVFGVARRYGFRPAARSGAAWESYALFVAILLLCIPLALSLRSIVVEARETNRVRTAIARTFEGAAPHITDLVVRTKGGEAAEVQCVVVTRKFVPDAAMVISRRLEGQTKVSVQQVVTASGVPTPDPNGALGARPSVGILGARALPEQRLRAMLAAAGEIQAIDLRGDGLSAEFVMHDPGGLEDYQALEEAAQKFIPETRIRIIPPLMELPTIEFERGTTQLDADARRRVDAAAWALSRWEMNALLVEGSASPNRRGPRPVDFRVAKARGDAVAAELHDRGIDDTRVIPTVPLKIEGDESRYLVVRLKLRPAPAPPIGAAR